MNATVVEVKKHPDASKDGWRVVTLANPDGEAKDFVVFKADLADALKPGQKLPDGSEMEEPKFPGALPALKLPFKGGGKGGGQAAWRNTREGFEAEQKMWARKQVIEEERKDRRTALMTIFEAAASGMNMDDVYQESERAYAWLRETSGSEA